MNIKTGKDLKRLSELELLRFFGKVGRFYFNLVRGIDKRPVEPNRQRKSIGVERTFSDDLNSIPEMIEKLEHIGDELKRRMDKGKSYGRTVTLKIRFNDFSIATRSKTTVKYLKEKSDLLQIAKELLSENIKEESQVRLLGIYISNLENEQMFLSGQQLEFDFQLP